MTEVLTRMDPALRKLLDSLPMEDPDRPMARVWCAWTEGEHKVPIGEWTMCQFGTWHGPTMPSREVPMWAEYLDKKVSIPVTKANKDTLYPNDTLNVNVLVTL